MSFNSGMEMLPHLRRLSKRSIFIYFICALFLICIIYTLYTDSYTSISETSIQKSLSDSLFNSASKELFSKDNSEQILPVQSPIVLPEATFKSSPNTSKNRSNSSSNHSIPNRTSNTQSDLLLRTVHTDTKYIYLTSSPTSSLGTSIKTTRFPKRTTQTTLPPDTCQTFTMKDSKLILLWTPFFERWGYLSEKRLSQCDRCRNCRITHDRSKLAESDAVVFHARDMSLSDVPPVRYPHQRWIFYCFESPPYSDFPGMDHMVNMFNWTMTYRSDSDVYTPYGGVKRIHPSRKLDLPYLQSSFNNKTKSVVWMSSHCPTHGGRDEFVEELRKWIDVDVYGSCGTSVCPPKETNKCLREFASKYKFFLAFENTICKDYVTEKFFRNLQYNMIPVVFGGASYSKVAPPGSYIDALSFKSPKHLAYFMAGIGNNFKMWSTYFKWRQDYAVDTRDERECNLCSMLHKKDIKPSSYENFKEWWISKANCRTWKPKR